MFSKAPDGPVAEIAEVQTEGDDLVFLKTLFVEYAESLGFSLCFQDFDAELAALPGSYARPRGNLWLARVDGAIAGCVGLRPLGDEAAEMKRLFVRPGFRGHRLGTRLTDIVIDYAREAGYRVLHLDTVRWMQEAQAIYRQRGFEPCTPYYDPDGLGGPEDLVFYKLAL